MTRPPFRPSLARPRAQVIAQPDERYESYCRSSDFIREHIFPGGHLPRCAARAMLSTAGRARAAPPPPAP